MIEPDSIDAIRLGDREAFERLVKKYQRMVEAVAYTTCGSRALVDDIVQDTFVSAWRAIDRLRDPTRVRAWLCGIARNVARNARRRRRDECEEVPDSPTPFDDLSEREREREVATALARLPASYREPLVLFYYEQCTVKEVANALAVGEDAAMQRISRGRRRLGEELAMKVEVELERKPSRAALAACVLALLPVRAATASTASGGATGAAPANGSRWQAAVGAIAAHKRIASGVVACSLGAAIVIVAARRSDEVARAEAHRAAKYDEPAQVTAPPPPQLPEQPAERTDRDGATVHANISPASVDAAETCARGARGLAFWVLGQDAYQFRDGALYFEPSPALQRAADVVATRAAETCRLASWPELYVRCEGTLAEIEAGSVGCYPYDPFVM